MQESICRYILYKMSTQKNLFDKNKNAFISGS